jgi:hypothetical protein
MHDGSLVVKLEFRLMTITSPDAEKRHHYLLLENPERILLRRFSFEAEKLVGSDIFKSRSWELSLFSALVEAVEVTAL